MADDVMALLSFPAFLPYRSAAWKQAVDGRGEKKKKTLAADALPGFVRISASCRANDVMWRYQMRAVNVRGGSVLPARQRGTCHFIIIIFFTTILSPECT